MKILLGTDVTVRGGVDRYVLDLAQALRAAGHRPVLVLEETTTSALRAASSHVQDMPIHWAALYHGRHEAQRLRAAAAAVLEEVRPDGVHIVCGSPRSCLTLRVAVVTGGLPLIVTEQQVKDDLRLSTSERSLISYTYRRARQVVFVSHGNRDTIARVVGLEGVSTAVISNGVDVAQIRSHARAARPPRRGSGKRIMTAARFSREKGLDVLVRATARLPADLLGQVDAYGEGPEQASLQRLIREEGLTGRFILRPWSPRVTELMAGYDLFVLPSSAEGHPYALLEAMSAGLGIVASDAAGNVEALAGGRAGTIVPRGDEAALAAAIAARLSDAEGTATLTRAAYERVRSRYDVVEQMGRTVALWAGL